MITSSGNLTTIDYYNLGNYIQKEKVKGRSNGWIAYLYEYVTLREQIFEYKNFPLPLTTEILENALMFRSNLCFAKISGINDIVLCNYVLEDNLNIYGKPSYVNLVDFIGNTLEEHVNFSYIVVVRDNYLDIPPFLELDYRINKLLKIENSMENTLFYNDIPALFFAPKEMVSMIEQIFKATDMQKRLVVSDNTSLDIKKFDIKTTLSMQELIDTYDHQKNLLCSHMGIETQIFKKERTNEKEINSNNDLCKSRLEQMFNIRKDFVNELNKMFNLNVTINKIQKETEVSEDGKV